MKWPYTTVTRDEFEKRKDFVALVLQDLGCIEIFGELQYKQKTTSYNKDGIVGECISDQPIYKYNNEFYRIDEVLFQDRPFIVLECASTWDEVLKDIMEDSDPFPYDLTDEEIVLEVKYSLGIEPYPKDSD